jgi:lipopolysaccharide export system permease protein
MNRLGLYIIRLAGGEALGIFGLSMAIMFLVECLRVSDGGGFAGGSIGSGLTIVLLGLPGIGLVFLTVALAMGLGRALRTLAASRELHIIHASNRIGALFGAILLYLVVGTLLVLVIAHEIAPTTSRLATSVRAEAAADLVNRSLRPNSFAPLSEGVTVSVTGRSGQGEITGFFADDRRSDPRRTYIARSALLVRDDLGYVLRLNDGRVQYLGADGRFSEMAFVHYDIGLERLTEAGSPNEQRRGTTTSALLTAVAGGETLDADQWRRIGERTAEGLRVLVLGLFVLAFVGFPDGRRKPPILPVELFVLLLALGERAVPSLLGGLGALAPLSGIISFGLVAVVIFAVRFLPRLPRLGPRRRVAP